MRHHVQGLVLLIVMLSVLWITVAWAGPIVGDALSGEDSALHAETAEAVDVEAEGDLPAPLTSEEVLELQAALKESGYDPGPIDGLLGGATRAAADQAIADRGLPATTTDRSLTARLQAELGGTNPDDARPNFDWELLGELIEAEARAEAQTQESTP